VAAAATHAGQASLGGHEGRDDEARQDSGTAGQAAQTAAVQNAGAAASAARSVPATPFELPQARTPVPLAHAPQAVQETITLAVRQGASLARIQLSPETLGPIDIHLHQTADGVVARVVAGPEAAQHFQQGADDLRRSLQASGINLVGLQIETSGGRDASAQAQAQAQADTPRRANAPADSDDGRAPAPSAVTGPTVAPGASINVLA
jgi:flagellar hook-length control protein FliK